MDYLVIGHATRDLKRSSFALGGTVVYAARTAQVLGCRVGIVTSAGNDLDLDGSLLGAFIKRRPAPVSTTFENLYTGNRRQQMIRGLAEPLGPQVVPSDWQSRLVHVAPVAQECDPVLVQTFGSAFVGVTPQGWMRRWDEEGRVTHRRWEEAARVLPYTDAVVLSEEDVDGDRTVAAQLARDTKCLVLTEGSAGCTVYAQGDVRQLPAPDVVEVDPTGAGDVFAAALFYALHRGHDAWTAARFANCIAARSVSRPGLSGTPGTEEVAHCRRAAFGRERNDVHHLRAG